MPIIVGIDPGKYGGLARIITAGRVWRCTSAIDVPLRADEEIDEMAVIAWLQETPPDVVWMERVQPMPRARTTRGERPGMPAGSAFKFGEAVGVLRTCARGLGLRVERCMPGVWKKEVGLSNKNAVGARKTDSVIKNESRELAKSIFGNEFWPLAKHHNRAEAALIAYYGTLPKRKR